MEQSRGASRTTMVRSKRSPSESTVLLGELMNSMNYDQLTETLLSSVISGRYGYVDPDGEKREYSYETGIKCDPNKRKSG